MPFYMPRVKMNDIIWQQTVNTFILRYQDSQEKGTAIHFSILAWGIIWIEEPAGLYSPWGHEKSDTAIFRRN